MGAVPAGVFTIRPSICRVSGQVAFKMPLTQTEASTSHSRTTRERLRHLIVTDHSCLTSTSLTGTSVQASANSSGDNPLTGDQENSNEGTASLSMTTTETVDTTETTFTVTFTLSGTSKSLSGQYSGTWPSSGSGCRSGFQGTLSITLD